MKLDDIKNVTIIGAGTMGHGIAHVGAAAGFETRLFDVDQAAREHGLALIEWIDGAMVQKEKSEVDSFLRVAVASQRVGKRDNHVIELPFATGARKDVQELFFQFLQPALGGEWIQHRHTAQHA